MLQTLHSTSDLRRSDMAYSAAAAAASPDPTVILERLKTAPQSFQLPELPVLVEALYSLPEQLLSERELVATKIKNVLDIFTQQLNLQSFNEIQQAFVQLKFLYLCLTNEQADPIPYAPLPASEPLGTPHLNGHSRRTSERDKPLNQELVELFLFSIYCLPGYLQRVQEYDEKFIMHNAITIATRMLNRRTFMSQLATVFGLINWQFYYTPYFGKAEDNYKADIQECLENLTTNHPAKVYVRLMGNYQNLNFSKLNFSFYDLRFVKLSGTKLGTSFKSGSNITGADFSYADVTEVWWAGCYVKDPNKLPIMMGTIGLNPNFMNDLRTHGIRPDLP